MTTPSKPNDKSTPLSVVPGVPHWKQTDHDQVDIGQGYDFHDPVSLQIGGESAYKTGTAISMFGKVGFRADQSIINTDHGRVYDLEITRKYGTQGTYDFLIKADMVKSTGVPGNIRTGVEHGFDVCKCDLDLVTLNPQITAEDGAYRIRMESGRSRMVIKAIAPYRTKVRVHEPVVLQKPLTYWVKEKFNAHVGMDEYSLGATDRRGDTPGYHGPFHLDATGLEIAGRSLERKTSIHWSYETPTSIRPQVSQEHTIYQTLTLPVPRSFIEPDVGIPEKEYWKDQFSIYEYENLQFTIGNSYDCFVYSRVYGVLPKYAARGSIYNNSVPGITDVIGLAMYNMFVAPSDPSWTNEFDHKWSKSDRYTTSYQSVKTLAFKSTDSDFWSVDYTNYINEALGDLILLENPVEHYEIPSGFNAMWNHVGVKPMSLADGVVTRYVDGTTREASDKHISNKYTCAASLNGVYCPGNHQSYWHDFIHPALEPWSKSTTVGNWTGSDPTLSDTVGVGEGGTSSVLYDLSNLTHPLTSYEKNIILKGFYKCCTDHIDREIVLTIAKADENDPVEMDTVTRSTTYINKSTLYDVSLHAEYDDTVRVDHAMPPGPVFTAGQAWDETPNGLSLTESLFVPEGSDKQSPVQFLSLSAGALAGGSSPGNKLKPPQPEVGPKLRIVPGGNFAENLATGSSKEYTAQYTNTGGKELTLTFNDNSGGIQSTTDSPYNSTSTPPSGDKLDDWTWLIESPYRTDTTGASNTVALSANETVKLKYTVDVATLNPDGYNVKHKYQVNKGPLYGGITEDETTFNISVF